MEKYTFEGTTYNVAPNRLEEFMVKFPNATKVDEPGKTIDPASNSMDSGSESGLLEQPEISAWQNIKNNLSNTFETSGDVAEFWGVVGEEDEGAQSGLSIASTMIWEGVFGREKMKEWKQTGFGEWFFDGLKASDEKDFQEVLEKFEKEKGETKQTMTFKEADSVGDYLSVATGAVLNVGGSVVYNLGTAGTGFFMEFAADNIIESNKIKAESKGKSLEQLLQDGEADVATPVKIAAVQAGLELFSVGKITKALGGKSVTKELGKNIAKKYAYNKAVRVGLDVASTGSTEALTEMTQYGLEFYNTELAKAKGKGKDINLVTTVAEGMFSEEGVEAGLQGFFGGGGLRGGAYSAKAMGQIRKTVSDVDVEKDLNSLVDLKRKVNETKDEDVKAGIEAKITDLEVSISDKIKKGNKIYESLSEGNVSEIENLGELADVTAYRATQLNKKLANGEISEQDHGLALEGLTNKFKKHRNKIQTIINNATVQEQVDVLKKETGIEGKITEMTSEEISSIEEEGFDSKTAAGEFGFIKQATDGSFEIILNKDKPMVGTAAHEFMHAVLFKTIGSNNEIQDNLGDALVEHTSKLGGETSILGERLSAYGKWDGDTFVRDANFGEETITIMSESIIDGSLKFEENFFTKIGDVVRRFSQNYLGKEITFDTGRDVYNFVKDYSKSIKDGKINKAILNIAKEGAKGKLIPKKAKPEATTQMSKDASDKVQNIYKEQGVAGAMDIIEQFKPIVSRIAERRREAPNFDRELLMSEIEIGERGIFDLISKYDPDSGVPLAAYINKFLPSRAIEASRRVLGEEFTEDVSERVDIAAEEVAEVEVEAKPRKKKIILSDRLGVKSKVDKAIKANLPELDIENLNFKTLKDQAPEITGEMFGISPKKLISGANITKKELQSAQMFINKNADVLISMLPEGATASGTATGVPQTLLKAFYTKTDRAKMAKTGTKAGLAVQVKNDIKKTDFLETFGIIDGKPDRTDRNTSARVLALANQTGKMMTNQAVREQLFENITEENAKSMLKLSDGKSAVMFSKSKAKENNMPNIAKYFGEKTEAEVASILDQHASLTEEQFKEAFPNEHGNVKNYIEDMAQFVADGGKEAMQFTKEMKGTNFGNSELTNYLKTGYWTLSDAKFKQDKKAMKWFVSNAHNLANQILLPKNATNGNMRMIMGFFAGHYNIVGSDMAKVGSVLKQGIVDRLNEKGKSVLSKETLSRWKNFDFENLKSSYASTFYTGLKKIYAANTLKEQKAIAKEYFTGKEGATQKDFYDLWNTTLEEWLHSNEVGSKEFNSKADYILKLKKANAAIGTTGERVMAPGGYVYLPGSIMDGKIKFEHLKSSSQQSKESALLVINNKFKEFGDLATEDYTGIYGPLELFNAVDDATGKVNSSNIFRLAGNLEAAKSIYSIDNLNQSLYDDIVSTIGKDKIKFLEQAGNKSQIKKLDKAIMFSRSANNETKGITVLDFDDTLATSKSLVISTSPDGVVRKLTAEEFATEGADLLDQGWTHDFSEFSKVVDGKVASLFKKAMKLQGKFGPENMFVLTARPADSAPAIFEFLKANGLNIPLKNITGLANSTAESKALWIADKVGEGYNDFYFADDALQNVQAVDNMLEQFDVKRKVQQAKVKFSKSMNDQFNDILENITGIEANKRFSIIKGRKRGEGKGKFRVFIPPSHEDFVGLLYNFLGRGKEGNAHRDFFEQALIRPLNRANREYDTARQSVANDYKELNKQFPEVKDKFTKKTADGDFTFQDAIRVYLWDKHGYKIPGLSETDQAKLAELVMSDPQLQAYAETLNVISKQETYVNPTDGWNGGDIRMDLDDATGRIGRKQFFSEFIENADVIFSEENLNKIEAGYGKGVRESLEDMLYRIETGRNRPTGQNAQVNNLMNYLNGSVGTVMFFNMRSALLQQMSIVNYINFADNNIFAAAKAFANQKQYWKDFAFIFNSDMLKQRRGGIQTDVNGAELAASLRNSKDITRKLISKLLELGFLPTQIGDNIAIATGGASYYRNRINKYIKQGMSQKEAEAAAFTDFQDITQSTQQSARPDMVSKQQASVIGKVILNFQNVTSQFNRLGKKAFQDIYNRRITKPNSTQMQSDISNAARITYYFAIQNAIFYTLQTALFAMMFDDDEEDVNNLFIKKRERLINGSIDSVLRGTGLIGGVVATLKNVAIAFARQRDVKYNPDESAVMLEALNLSPVLGIKGRKIVNAEKTLNYNKKVIKEMETFDIDNPQWSAVTSYTEAFTNVPLNRLYNKTQNVRQALNNDHSAWERSLMFLGWSQYNLDLENKKMEEIKEKTRSKKKKKSKKKSSLGKSVLGKRL